MMPPGVFLSQGAAASHLRRMGPFMAYGSNRRRLLLVGCVYPPEPMVSARVGSDLAHHLQASGLDIEVVCPMPSRPRGAVYAGVRAGVTNEPRTFGSVRVQRVMSYNAPQSRLLTRLRESASFGRASSLALRSAVVKPDTVYANTWPMMAQWQLAKTCQQLGIPLVLHIQDLYPEALLERLPAALRLVAKGPLTAVDAWLARQSSALVVVSEAMADTYRSTRGVVPDKLTVVNNWIDEDSFAALPDRSDAHQHYGLDPNSFTYLYCGNVGAVARVETLIKAFHCAVLSEAKLVVAGGGSERERCIQLVRERKIRNVHFVADEAAENTALLHSLGDVCLLPMRSGTVESSVPSKLISYMMSARPIIATVHGGGTIAKQIGAAGCGWVGESENEEWLAQQMRIVALMDQRNLNEIGQKGRAYAMQHFSRAKGLELLSGVIKSVLPPDAARTRVTT
jgi:glycosyltransferase involved in cell wall biosynthesis